MVIVDTYVILYMWSFKYAMQYSYVHIGITT